MPNLFQWRKVRHSQAFIDYAIARRVEPLRMTVLGCRRLSEQQELMTSVKPMRGVSWLLGSRKIWRQRVPWARSNIRVRLLKRAVAFPTFFLDNRGMALIVFLR